MKAKIKRVQGSEFDFSSLSEQDLLIYINGLTGSLISTISNQCLAEPFFVAACMAEYLADFDPKTYLRLTRECREHMQSIIKG